MPAKPDNRPKCSKCKVGPACVRSTVAPHLCFNCGTRERGRECHRRWVARKAAEKKGQPIPKPAEPFSLFMFKPPAA